MNIIRYKDITKENLLNYNKQEVKIILEDEEFFVKLDIKPDNNQLVVFSNGAVNREKKTPPLFMRSTWADEIEASCIYLDDKTIHGSNVRIGWGIGRFNRHFINDYSRIIKKISSQLSLRPKNVIYYGSSAGGFMSMMLASKHKYTTAIVNNPQTNVFNFHEAHVKDVCDYVFPGVPIEEIKSSFKNRFSIIDTLVEEDYVPRIFYYQNNKHLEDMNRHFLPFVQGLKDNQLVDRKITYFLYNNKGLGHDPLPKEITVANINHILNTIDLRY